MAQSEDNRSKEREDFEYTRTKAVASHLSVEQKAGVEQRARGSSTPVPRPRSAEAKLLQEIEKPVHAMGSFLAMANAQRVQEGKQPSEEVEAVSKKLLNWASKAKMACNSDAGDVDLMALLEERPDLHQASADIHEFLEKDAREDAADADASVMTKGFPGSQNASQMLYTATQKLTGLNPMIKEQVFAAKNRFSINQGRYEEDVEKTASDEAGAITHRLGTPSMTPKPPGGEN